MKNDYKVALWNLALFACICVGLVAVVVDPDPIILLQAMLINCGVLFCFERREIAQ